MKQLRPGEFYGHTDHTSWMSGITLTTTEYTQAEVDWHYHEQPYFTLLLQGRMLETSRHNNQYCVAGTLLFHHWQEEHRNTKPPGSTRGFHIELSKDWLDKYDIDLRATQGSQAINDPSIRQLMYQLLCEQGRGVDASETAIHALLIEALGLMTGPGCDLESGTPAWVGRVREYLLDNHGAEASLGVLAIIADVHPVHLCRNFACYFGMRLGRYTRIIRLLHAISMMPEDHHSLTGIALECGFADQSHFIRSFKTIYGIRPLQARSLLKFAGKR